MDRLNPLAWWLRAFILCAFVLSVASCSGSIIYLPTPTPRPIGSGSLAPAPGVTPAPMLLEKRLLILEWPMQMREKDSALVELKIVMDQQGALTATATGSNLPSERLPVDIPNIYTTHNLVAIARLDMAGVEAFRDDIREPLQPGREVIFRWSIYASQAGNYKGVVWLHLDMVPKSGGSTEEVLLLARPIEVQAVTVFGLPADIARYTGVIGLVLSMVMGFPFFKDWINSLQKRQRKRAAPHKKNIPSSRDGG